jgi:glutathionylspermidine synthase
VTTSQYRAEAALEAEEFALVRRAMLLEHCKWDPQVGDAATLAAFPLIMERESWSQLAGWAEALTAEAIEAERELLTRPELLRRLGLPRSICNALLRTTARRELPRAARYDFHLTREGWRISECNADVPGGYAEASAFSAVMSQHYGDAEPAGDPGGAWAEALARTAQGDDIALLSAPGFMEDHQVVRYLAKRIAELGLRVHCAQPAQIEWRDGYGFLGAQRLGAILRFYQAEWLATLPRGTEWWRYFGEAATPILNPGSCITIESKRFPLVWDALATRLPTWRKLLPPTVDPREAPWQRDDSWLLKTALCNTGDTVMARSLLPPARWAKAARSARWFPGGWVAQRRFEPIPIESPFGAVFPCIGVYTIDGRACGAYARLSRGPIVDFAAIDVALLLQGASHAAVA